MAFAWYIPVTLNNSGSPFALGSYQVPIDLTSAWASDIFAKARSDGADIAIYDSTGTTLQNYWLEYYTPGSSVGRLWLNVNSLAIGSSATYQIQYDDPARSVSLGSFDATFQKLQLADIGSGNVLACFRYDDGSGTTPVDATGTYSASSTVNGGTPTWLGHAGGAWLGYNGSSAQNGTHFASGSAIHFNGSEAHLITGLLDNPPAAGEIGLWFAPDSTINNTTTGFPHLFCKVNAGTTQAWTSTFRAYFDTDGTLTVQQIYNAVGSASTYQAIKSQTTSWTAGTWHHMQVRWNLSTFELWIDGVMEASAPTNQGSGNGQWPSGAANPFSFGSAWQSNAGLAFQSSVPFQSFTGYIYQAYVLQTEPTYDYDYAVTTWRKYQQGMGANSRLTKQGAVLSPSGTAGTWNQCIQDEPNPVVNGAELRMASTGFNVNNSPIDKLGLFTSTDGSTFSVPGGVTNPLFEGCGSCYFKDPNSSTWYWYYVKSSDAQPNGQLYYQTSTDGLSWPGPEHSVSGMSAVSLGYGSSAQIYNPYIDWDATNSRYMMLLGSTLTSAGPWRTTLFTAPNLTSGGTWTVLGSNPQSALQFETGSYSFQWWRRRTDGTGIYDVIGHISTKGLLPSYLAHAWTTDFSTWHKDYPFLLGLENESFAVTGYDGKTGPADQIADGRIVFFNNATRLYHDTCRNDSAGNMKQGRNGLATYGSTIDSLFTLYPVESFGSPTQTGTTLALAALSAAWTNPSLSFSSSLALAQEAAAWTSPALVQALALAMGQQAAAWANPGITIPGSSLNLAAQAAAFSNPSLLSPSLALGLAAESAGWSNPALNASYAVALAAESAGWSNPAITFASSGGSALSLPAEVATFTVNDLALFFCPTILKPYLGLESCVISDTEQVTLFRKLADGVFDVGTNVGQALRLEIGKSQAIGSHGAKVVNRLNWILWANQAGAGVKNGDVIQDLYGVRWVIEKTHVQAWGLRYLVETVQVR